MKQEDFNPIAFKNFLEAKDICASKFANMRSCDKPVTLTWDELYYLREAIPALDEFINHSTI